MIPNKSRSHKGACLMLVSGAALVLALPLQGQSQRARLLTTDRAAADSSQHHGLAAAISTFGAADVIIHFPGAPVARGPAVQQLLAGQPSLSAVRITWQPTAGEISPDSTLGATWGVAAITPVSGAGPVRLARYLSAWTRLDDSWKLQAMVLPELGEAGYVAVPSLAAEQVPVPASSSPFAAADLAFAKLAADSGAGIAFARFAAPEAEMWTGAGLLVEGPDNIGRLVTGPNSWRWHPVAFGTSRDGEMGWTVGEAVISTPDGHAGPSKYLTIWRRQPDGTVKFITDGGNGR